MRYFHFAVVTFLLASLCGCQKDGIGLHETDDQFVSFEVATCGFGSSVETKASVMSSSDGSVSLPLSCIVSEGIGGLRDVTMASPMTKGEQINTTDIVKDTLSKYASSIGGKFSVKAFGSDGTGFIPSGGTERFDMVTYSSSSNEWAISGNAYTWDGLDEKTFYAYANMPANVTEVVEAGVECADATGETLTYAQVPVDARSQNDILMGFYKGNGEYDAATLKGGIARLTFYHPMTAVRFVMGEFTGVTGEVSIKGITIGNVYKGGVARITPSSVAEADPDDKVLWTPGSEMQTVTLGDGSAALSVDSETGVIGGADGAFLLVPQDLAAKSVTVNAVVEINGKVFTISSVLSTGKWKAGCTNTYTLGYDGRNRTYDFRLTNASDAAKMFINTSADSDPVSIPVTSTLRRGSDTPDPHDWTIMSYRIGEEDPVTVGGTSFAGKGGLTVEKDGGDLKVTALARTNAQTGSHGYWVNSADRKESLDWSPADWSDKGTIDLSKLDFRTESTSMPMTTANCYIIRHAGTYKLPLVYGNGIVNGKVNEQSYYPNATGGQYRLERFVNHRGNGITNPFIEYNTTDGNAKSESNSYLAPADRADGYSVVWQDEADILTIDGISKESVTVKNAGGTDETYDVSYITFTIPQDKICQNNAVIAVKDADGKIMWSWCIWTTNDPALLTSPVKVTNYDNNNYYFFPIYSIGWVDTSNYPGREQVVITLRQSDSGKTLDVIVDQPIVPGPSAANYYQFGRKDPICRKDTPASGSFDKRGSGSDKADLKTSIQNPGVFYKFGKTNVYDWCTPTYYNLWTGRKSSSGATENDADIIKTIYDPSPAGYKVPASKAFTGFTTTGGNTSTASQFNVRGSISNVCYFYTSLGPGHTVNTSGPMLFFTFSGYRGTSSGSPMIHVGNYGFFQASNPATEKFVYGLYCGYDRVYPFGSNFYRADALPVRPVLE